MRKNKFDMDMVRVARKDWVPLNTDNMNEEEKTLYLKKKKALDMYIDGVPVKTIESQTGINRGSYSRILERALSDDAEGKQYGYNSLIYYSRTNDVNTSRPAGTFQKLLADYPCLKEFLLGNYFGNKKYTLEKNMDFRTVQLKFLDECKRLGIQSFEYPFNTKNKAYPAIVRFLTNAENKDINTMAKRQGKDAAQKFLSTGIGKVYTVMPVAPYQMVQVDGHKLDIEYAVEFLDKDGLVQKLPAMRPWLFVVIDTATRAILGYSLTQSEEYNQFDVLKAFRHAILPKTRINFMLPGLKYPENGGFPDTAIPELQYSLMSGVMLDNAMSHLADNTVGKLVDVLGAEVCFGSVATPESRGIVERFFQTLEKCGLHKLSNTTGSNTRDLKRNSPEAQTVKYDITFNDIEQIVEWLIVLYNNSANSAIDNETPINLMRSRTVGRMLFPAKGDDTETMRNVQKLTFFTDTRVVRASRANGKRPHIEYMGAIYRSDKLSYNMEYEGMKLTLEINPDNIRMMDAYGPDGRFIDKLYATGVWGRTDHSLQVRKWCNRVRNENGEVNEPFRPPVHNLEEELNSRAGKNRRARTKAEIVRKSGGMDAPSVQQAKPRKETEIININPAPKDEESPDNTELIMKLTQEMTPEEFFDKYAYLLK